MVSERMLVGGRYEITEKPLGQGGMGVVYKAYDNVTKRFVALKTLFADPSPQVLAMFEREWTFQSRLSHPNILDILDRGEWEFSGQKRPYFVMPLLDGATLDEIIKKGNERLSVDRVVGIISQACRGLEAAHAQNVVHRDIKPSNIFVMADDTVKLIDFGMAHQEDERSLGSMRGTPLYMAPEQLDAKPATPLSDIFSLGAVCYEALTGRNPFARKTEGELAEAIRTYVPPPASEINPAVNQLISRTVHKAMAKQPWHRFSNAREFGETLEKALRNEPIERFDRAKIQPRIDRVQKAYAEGDERFALEILRELESEGHIDPDMSSLRIQIEQSLRQRNLGQLLASARVRMDEQEYLLALQKVADALAVDPENNDARALKVQIERVRNENQVENWFRLVRDQMANHMFGQARQGLEQILHLDSSNTAARRLLAEVDQTEQEVVRLRDEKQKLYQAALASYKNGEINTALNQLEKVLDLARRNNPLATPDLDAEAQALHDKLRGERDEARNAYSDGRKNLNEGNTARALEICQEYLSRHPDDPMFQALKLEAEEAQREQLSEAIADVTKRAEAEADLEKKYTIVKDAADRFPGEAHFVSALKLIRDRRDLVATIVNRARQYEERGQFSDAAGQWEILRNIYPAYPGLDLEMERATRRKEEQAHNEAKARWKERVEAHFNTGEYAKAQSVVSEALAAFPDDNELLQMRGLAEQSLSQSSEANELLKQGQELCAARNYSEGLAVLRRAGKLDPRNGLARAALLSALVSEARELIGKDWRSAEPLVREALDIEPADPVARSLASILEDYRRQDAIGNILVETRNLQADGRPEDALKRIEEGVRQFPNEARLSQLYNSLRQQTGEIQRPPALSPSPAELESISSLPPVPDGATTLFGPPRPSTEPRDVVAEPAKPKLFEPVKKGADLAAGSKSPQGRIPPPPTAGHKMASRPAEQRSVWNIALFSAATLIVAAALYTLFSSHRPPAPPPRQNVEPAPVAVVLESDVPNTRFVENGQAVASTGTLNVGEHTIIATHEGYVSDTKTLSIGPETKAPLVVRFVLQPALTQIHLASGITQGKALIDETESVELQAGVLAKDGLAAGPHLLKVFDHNRLVFSIAFESKAGQMPTLLTPLSAQPTAGVVIASLNGAARVYSTANVRVGTGGVVTGAAPAQGLELAGTPDNPGRFSLEITKGHKNEQLAESSPFPVLTIQLAGGVQPALLALTANVADYKVFVDDKVLPPGGKGAARTITLSPGKHSIRLAHDGFQPSDQKLEVKPSDAGTTKTMAFVLTPIPAAPAAMPKNGTLTISGAPAEAAVFQNGVRIGTVGANGVFSREIEPGQYNWEWRKAGYATRQESRSVKAGENLRIDGAMSALTGTLLVRVTPAGARIAARREGETAESAITNGSAVQLTPGTYHVTAAANDYNSREENVIVEAGKSDTLTWDLEKTKVVAWPLRFFEDGETWKQVNPAAPWATHRGSYSALRASTGTFHFDFLKQKGNLRGVKKINLQADCADEDNCTTISIDSHNLVWKTTAHGEILKYDKKEHRMDNDASYQFVFEMSKETIVIKNNAGEVLASIQRTSPGKLMVQDNTPLTVN